MNDLESAFGIFFIGFFTGLFTWVFVIGFMIIPANIDYENGYTIIEVIKITKYSDGMQIVEATGYTQFLNLRISENYTYEDPKKLISSLGVYKIKTPDRYTRNIESTISIEEVIS